MHDCVQLEHGGHRLHDHVRVQRRSEVRYLHTHATCSIAGHCSSPSFLTERCTRHARRDTRSTRVSNEIGAGNVEGAKNAVAVTLKLSVFLAAAFVLLLGFGHGLWAGLFSGSAIIAAEFAAVAPLMMASILLDSAQGVLSGVARGCGWQHLAAVTNLVAFYFIGMPLAIFFAFKLKWYTKVVHYLHLQSHINPFHFCFTKITCM